MRKNFIVVLLTVVVSSVLFTPLAGYSGFFSRYKSVQDTNGEVRINIGDVSDGKAHYYTYKKEGKTIKFFVVKSPDGVIRAAFDACDVCWPAGKGYFQDGDEMVCRNCGRRFASVLVNEVQGGCNPAPLNRSIEGDQLVIKTEDIMNGQTYFNFKGKV